MWGLPVLPGIDTDGIGLAACRTDEAPYNPPSAGAAGRDSVGDEGPASLTQAQDQADHFVCRSAQVAAHLLDLTSRVPATELIQFLTLAGFLMPSACVASAAKSLHSTLYFA